MVYSNERFFFLRYNHVVPAPQGMAGNPLVQFDDALKTRHLHEVVHHFNSQKLCPARIKMTRDLFFYFLVISASTSNESENPC